MVHCGAGFTFLDESRERNNVRKVSDLQIIVVLILIQSKQQTVQLAGKWPVAPEIYIANQLESWH